MSSPFSPEALQSAILNTPALQSAQQTQQAPTQSGVGVGPYAALFAGQGADAASTAYNFSRGYRESNPLYGQDPSLARILAVKAGMTGGLGLLMHQLAAHGHPGAAKVLGYVGGIGGAVPAAINLSQK
jgi:hypothetical protein